MRRKCLLGLLAVLMIVAAACSKDAGKEEIEKPDDVGSTDTETLGEGLVIALNADANSLDPHGANDGTSLYIMSTMYDKLVYLDKDLNITPGLAESLEPISDTVWEAKIRKDVKFHDGENLTAEAVKANLDRVRDPKVASPLSFLFEMIKEVKVVNEYTVHIETEYPFASLPAHLAHPAGHIISPKSIAEDYEAIENGELPFASVNELPIGTGPFKFKSRDYGTSIVVEENENYWDAEKAKSASITFKVIPEDFTRISELETGGADIIYPVSPAHIEQIEEAATVQQSKSSNLTYLGFNTEVEPYTDPKVRQAISMAINKQDLIEGVLDGVALPAKGPLAPTVFGYTEDIKTLDYDVEKAKELLTEAGYPDGFSTTLLTNDTATNRDTSVFVQAELAKIGIEVSIDTAETGAYLDATGNGNSEMFIGSWGTVTLDADYGLYPMFHSSNAGAPGNRSFLNSKKVDELLEAGRVETDPDARLKIYQEAQNQLAEEAPAVYLYHSELLAGVGNDVKDFWQYPSSIFYLKDAYK